MDNMVKWDMYGNTNMYISGETVVTVAQRSLTDIECLAKCVSVNIMMTSSHPKNTVSFF